MQKDQEYPRAGDKKKKRGRREFRYTGEHEEPFLWLPNQTTLQKLTVGQITKAVPDTRPWVYQLDQSSPRNSRHVHGGRCVWVVVWVLGLAY